MCDIASIARWTIMKPSRRDHAGKEEVNQQKDQDNAGRDKTSASSSAIEKFHLLNL